MIESLLKHLGANLKSGSIARCKIIASLIKDACEKKVTRVDMTFLNDDFKEVEIQFNLASPSRLLVIFFEFDLMPRRQSNVINMTNWLNHLDHIQVYMT